MTINETMPRASGKQPPWPSLDAARYLIDSIHPDVYARTRNSLDGEVSGLSPYITHGFVTLVDVLGAVDKRHQLNVRHKFVYELGWRAFYRHVWHHKQSAIFRSLHPGPLPDHLYLPELPEDIRLGATGVPVVDMAVRTLYATGGLHNHARMWLASYVVHVRKVHWCTGADWMYSHLLDGDLASNHLSWQWVAGTGSSKPYLFNAENVARYASNPWHSPGSVLDATYEAMDLLARTPKALQTLSDKPPPGIPLEPTVTDVPPVSLGANVPSAIGMEGKEVWLVHPWNLGELPADLSPDTSVIGIFLADFHRNRPWSQMRWNFVGTRMAELATCRWYGDAQSMAQALRGAKRVRSSADPHLMPWLEKIAKFALEPQLFAPVDKLCSSFSQWWRTAIGDKQSAADLLERNR